MIWVTGDTHGGWIHRVNMESLIDYPEETLHDDIEAHADNIYEDWIGEL